MKTFTAYRENVTGDKWKIGWREGDTELCSQTLEVVGEQDAVRQALDANLSVLRERNSSLFQDDEGPEPIMMEANTDVQ